MKSLLRIKINFYPNTHEVVEHTSHIDYDFSHTAAIFSLNTCDGYTKSVMMLLWIVLKIGWYSLMDLISIDLQQLQINQADLT